MSAGTTAIDISDEASTQMLGGAALTDKPAAILRGTARGLEIVIDAPAGLDAIIDTIDARLAEAPTFFRGSDVRVQVKDGPLPAGSLSLLEGLAQQYDLHIVELGAAKPELRRVVKVTEDAIPPVALAIGSGAFDDVPTSEGEVYRADRAEDFGDIPTQILPSPPNSVVMATAMVLAPALGTIALHDALASARTGLSWLPPKRVVPVVPNPIVEQELEVEHLEPETRIVVGPVRSGVILDHRGHVIVFGDVNPGAEVRAAGNIVVLGKLKGLAHAGIGAEAGFIVALHLQPQQLRIGRMVARSSDDITTPIPEIAYVSNGSIVVERYTGKLPPGQAASLK